MVQFRAASPPTIFFVLSVLPGRNPELARVTPALFREVHWPSLPDLSCQRVCLYVRQLSAFASFECRSQSFSIQSPCATSVQVCRVVRSVGCGAVGAMEPSGCADWRIDCDHARNYSRGWSRYDGDVWNRDPATRPGDPG